MDLTVDDITTLFKFPQSKKHSSPIVSTPSGITIDSKLLQFTNTLSPINSVLPGIFISCATVEEDVIEENDIIFSVMPEAIEINDNHLKLSQMNFHYKMPSTNTKYSISKNELNTLLKEKTFKRTRIYVDKAISDINLDV